jgi:hypothetical protein
VLKCFSSEGDTVSVGGNLFEIDMDSSSTEQPISTTPVEHLPLAPTSKLESKPTISNLSRKPQIRFLGPRKLLWKTHERTALAETTPVINDKTNNMIFYESMDQMPSKYQHFPFSELEIQAIDSGSADYQVE